MPSWKRISNWGAAEESTGGDSPLAVEQRLRLLEGAYKAGNVLALFEAGDLCDREGIQLPAWIPLAALDLIALTLQDGLSAKRRRGSHQLKRLQANLKHFARWETVRSLVEHRETGWREFQEHLQSPDLSAQTRKKLLGQAPYNPGKNLKETFVRASEALIGTAASGGEDGIEASYKLFEKAFDPEDFTVVSPKIYRQFGLDPMTSFRPKPGRKARAKR